MWNRWPASGGGPAAAMARALRLTALDCSHELQLHIPSPFTQGCGGWAAWTRNPLQNSRAWSTQTRPGFVMIIVVAGRPQKGHGSMPQG
jgi:hypothetical protein